MDGHWTKYQDFKVWWVSGLNYNQEMLIGLGCLSEMNIVVADLERCVIQKVSWS